MLLIKDLGEFGLIDVLNHRIPPLTGRVLKGIGDDTAVLKSPDGKLMLFTTDMLVEDVHFSFRYQPLHSVGWKALAVNISDIAAMGGQSDFAVISIGIPAGWQVSQVEEIYSGLADCAGEYGVEIVGGDTVRSLQGLVINVALTGHVEPTSVKYRSGARPGDTIMVTGLLGGSAAGLYILHHDLLNIVHKTRQDAVNSHFFPRPRVREGLVLGNSGYVTSMNDISDGLASEVLEICRASRTGCELDGQAVPFAEAAAEIAGRAGRKPADWALYGGEDFELVFTVDPAGVDFIRSALSELGCAVASIGMITKPEQDCILMDGGRRSTLRPGGYNHFRD